MKTIFRPEHYFKCPACQGSLIQDGALRCNNCGSVFAVHDGIVSFVADGVRTKLDDIEYDTFYNVDIASSLEMFRQLKQVVGPRLRDRYGSLLEVGAGTGGLTAGFLMNVLVEHAIITDISAQMLRVCKERLLDKSAGQLSYATYSGVEDILLEERFDCVLGSFVLHHVSNYQLLFDRLFSTLRVGGSCIFIEPGYRFHKALIMTMIDVVETLFHTHSDNEAGDFIRLTNWLAEVRFNIKFQGNFEILETREDKHLFRPEDVQRAAIDAGFHEFESMPYGSGDESRSAIEVYTSQLMLSDTFRASVLELFVDYAPRHFESLNAADAAPSYVFILRKLLSRHAENEDSEPALRNNVVFPISRPPILQHHVLLDLKANGDHYTIRITGWAVSNSEILFARIDLPGRLAFAAPVAWPRQDVQGAINASRGILFEYTFFCGIDREEIIPCYQPERVLEGRLTYQLKCGLVIAVGEFSIGVDDPVMFWA